MTPYQVWYSNKPDLSQLHIIRSKREYLIPPKQRKKITDPRTRPYLLLRYKGNTNYRILLEDNRIIRTPNTKFHKVLITPSTQTRHVETAQDNSPAVTTAATEKNKTVRLLNQPSVNIQHTSVPASSRQLSATPQEQRLPELNHEPSSQSSNKNSQPVPGEGDTPSPSRSEDTFRSFSDVPRETAYGSDSPNNSDQQQNNPQSDPRLEDSNAELQHDRPANTVQQQDPILGDSNAELQHDRPEHTMQQETLEHHPELRIRSSQDTSFENEELALINIPIRKIIPTFLTIAAEDTEPFEPKTLRQAMNNTS